MNIKTILISSLLVASLYFNTVAIADVTLMCTIACQHKCISMLDMPNLEYKYISSEKIRKCTGECVNNRSAPACLDARDASFKAMADNPNPCIAVDCTKACADPNGTDGSACCNCKPPIA